MLLYLFLFCREGTCTALAKLHLTIIIVILILCITPTDNVPMHFYIISPGHWANIIPVIFLSSLGSIQPILCNLFRGATGLIKHNYHLYPHRYPFIHLGEEKQLQLHGRGQGSNPHLDDSAIRTQVRCTRPLGHDIP